MEVTGFIVRILGYNNPCNDNTEIVQKIFLLVAPSVFAATIYMILGRIILSIDAASLSPIRPSRLTIIFVTGDIACFFIQLSGAAIMSNGGSSIDTGKYIILAGLGLQMLLFSLFVFVAYVFHKRIQKNRTDASRLPGIQWESMLFVLYGVSGIIMLRNLFRVVETSGGRDGYLLTHKWPLYVFDSILMAAVMAILLYYSPVMIRPRSRSSYGMEMLESQPVLGQVRRKHHSDRSPPSVSSQ